MQESSHPINATEFATNMAQASELWQRIMGRLAGTQFGKTAIGQTDPLSFAESLLHNMRHISLDPMQVLESNMALFAEHTKLWHSITAKMLGREATPLIIESPRDRRFKDAAWNENPVFDLIKQSYLINSEYLMQNTGKLQGLEPKDKHKMNFFVRQFVDAMSPSNFVVTNPEVMRTTLESNGENLVNGLTQLLEDIERGDGKLRISMTDEEAFTLGKNIATSKGSVVYRNELMELMQFEATTKQVYEIPILITPAWINKYYVLDLREENSLVRWLTKQGFTVFVISWVNPDQKLGRKGFDDYLLQGPLAALDVVESITGSKKTHMVGYCLGGTLTAITNAYLKAHKEDHRVASASYLTTLVDFSDVGDIAVFIDDSQLDSLEDRMSEQGYLDAADMASTFNMLRANDLIWSFVVNNYLLGKNPFPFDLLYWNSDSTRMPATMHAFYLRTMYQQNLLIKPNGIELAGTPINLTKITVPSYVLSTKDDHIAPWISTYAATQAYDGDVCFTLADSGHIAGVINPPSKAKYCYWTNNETPPKAKHWFEEATKHEGSWWPHWQAWLTPRAGKKVPARAVGNKRYKPIEPAPGSYAKVRA
jgi:polyhydroxyalkanoate synthase